MKTIHFIACAVLLSSSLTLVSQEAKQAPEKPAPGTMSKNVVLPPPDVTNRCILLVNCAGISPDQFEVIRCYGENNCWLKVEGVTVDAEWSTLAEKAPTLMSGNRKLVIVLGNGPVTGPRLIVAPDDRWAIVNVASFTQAGPVKNPAFRLQQAMMRGIGFAVGLPSCMDMHCIMRRIRVQSDLDQMGSNFCGPTRRTFQVNCNQIGLHPFPPALINKMKEQAGKETKKP